MRRLVIAVLLAGAVAPAGPAPAQDRAQSLADIRADLRILDAEVQGLRAELQGGASGLALQGTSALERIDAIEAALAGLTARTEEIGNRVNQVVADGTNRIGDLEFRLTELEGGDISTLGETPALGGADLPAITAPAPAQPGPELAVGEQRDFDRAKAAYDAGSYETAVIQFATFTETYLGGPLAAEAHFWRGRSLDALGNVSGAARAYLEAFSGDPDGTRAPDALLELGRALGRLGQVPEACTMLGEVAARFPAAAAATDAEAARREIGCG